MSEKEWIEIGTVIGDTGPKGDTGDIGIGTVIKGHYNNYSEFITVHPSGRIGDAYIVDGSYYYWNENGWANAGSVRGEKGDTGASAYVNVNHEGGIINIGVNGGESESISFNELKGDVGPKGDTGDKGVKGDTGPATDENAGWKLPVDEILTTSTLPTGVKKGYRVAICTSSLLAIKEYNGISWETESLDAYSVIPLKHSGSIQMYLAKSSGPVYLMF